MMDFYEVTKQHREDMVREAEQNRLARGLRTSRKRRAGVKGRASGFTWEVKRIAGRLVKLVKSLRDAG